MFKTSTTKYVVPTGRVNVPAGRYVVPTSKDNVIVSAGRSKVIPAETKPRTILLQSLPEDHMADFHNLDNARDIWLAVKARISESEGLHKGYDRFQKILSQLIQMQSKPDNEDCNMKFLRALLPSWSQDLKINVKGAQVMIPRGSRWILIASNLHSKYILPFGCEHNYQNFKKDFDNLGVQYKDCYILVKLEVGLGKVLNRRNGSLQKPGQTDHRSCPQIKIWFRFGETFGSDEVFDPSAPSFFDTHLRIVEGRKNLFTISESLIVDKSSELMRPFACFSVSSVKSSSSKTNEPSASSLVDFKIYKYSSVVPRASGSDGIRISPASVSVVVLFLLVVGIDQHLFLLDNPHKNKDLEIVDSGCSRSMTGNKEKLDDFVKIIGGTVTFGGRDGKITRKGTIRTSKLNFENVYYVEELQNFNLFSVSQICDKKNKVLFTDTECLVLTKEFQLPENSQVVLRVPRRHNLYSFNLTEIQPESTSISEYHLHFTTSRYVVPIGRVKVPASRYVVPTGKDNVIVSAGRSKVIPVGRTILVLVVLCLLRVDSIVS
ncbi:hypothetical protein Tco_0947666 [Tanacetum coccineum]